ncbi:MAG: hypothetical protein IRZ33_00490 [Alicyclobacillaceae bacterium]|nr:hypothetical protein [Alicyclobacillaceae bacterium]
MKKFTMILFIIALIIVAIETFRPQPPFPAEGTSFAVPAAGVHQTADPSM